MENASVAQGMTAQRSGQREMPQTDEQRCTHPRVLAPAMWHVEASLISRQCCCSMEKPSCPEMPRATKATGFQAAPPVEQQNQYIYMLACKQPLAPPYLFYSTSAIPIHTSIEGDILTQHPPSHNVRPPSNSCPAIMAFSSSSLFMNHRSPYTLVLITKSYTHMMSTHSRETEIEHHYCLLLILIFLSSACKGGTWGNGFAHGAQIHVKQGHFEGDSKEVEKTRGLVNSIRYDVSFWSRWRVSLRAQF